MYFQNYPEMIFAEVKVMIYVYDVSKLEKAEFDYFERCTRYLQKYSPDAYVFVLFHKTDLLVNLNKEEVIIYGLIIDFRREQKQGNSILEQH